MTDYFTRRARGGVSFIMVGPAVFNPVGSSGTFEYRIDRDEIREGLSRLVQEIHSCGVPVGLQLHHAGRQANPDLIEGIPVAPSAIPCPVRKSQPRALSIPEIERIVEQYGIFAGKAREMLLGKMIKDKMREEGVRILTGQKVVQVKEGGVVCEDSGKGHQTKIPANGVVLAVGSVPRDDLVERLSKLCPETHVIGDCRKPRKALDAIYEGAKAGLQI